MIVRCKPASRCWALLLAALLWHGVAHADFNACLDTLVEEQLPAPDHLWESQASVRARVERAIAKAATLSVHLCVSLSVPAELLSSPPNAPLSRVSLEGLFKRLDVDANVYESRSDPGAPQVAGAGASAKAQVKLFISGMRLDDEDVRFNRFAQLLSREPDRLLAFQDPEARASAALIAATERLCEPWMQYAAGLFRDRPEACRMDWTAFWRIVIRFRADFIAAPVQQLTAVLRATDSVSGVMAEARSFLLSEASGTIAQQAALRRLCSSDPNALPAARRMLAHWGELTRTAPEDLRTWWICAAREPSGKALTLLRATGLNIRAARDESGNTALHEAVSRHEPSRVLMRLLDAGADASAPNNRGDTPLHMAASRTIHPRGVVHAVGGIVLAAVRPAQFQQDFALLVRAGAQPDAVNAVGESARQLKARAEKDAANQ